MHPFAFILAILAALCFLLAALGRDYPRPLVLPAGLCLLTVAWIVQLTVETVDPVNF